MEPPWSAAAPDIVGLHAIAVDRAARTPYAACGLNSTVTARVPIGAYSHAPAGPILDARERIPHLGGAARPRDAHVSRNRPGRRQCHLHFDPVRQTSGA